MVLPSPYHGFVLNESAPGTRLDSWKEIAAYLKRSVRTVQRWEQSASLPVCRTPHEKKGAVFAYTHELDSWWTSRGSSLAAEPEDSVDAALQTGGGRYLWTAVLFVTVVLAGTAIWVVFRTMHRTTPMLRIVPLTTYPGVELFPAFSPDGIRIAFSWQPPDQWRSIYVQVIGTSGSPLKLSNSENGPGNIPAWSPDGRYVSFLRNDPTTNRLSLIVVPSLGGPDGL